MQRRNFITDTTKYTLLGSLFPLGSFFQQKQNTAPLKLIIDADTANEVDDLYAIARALLEPRLNIIGLTSAQWHTNPRTPNDSVGESQRLNEEILALMEKTTIPTPEGANFPLVNEQRPQPSEAAKFIIEQALAMPDGEQLSIAILGPCTNIASAVLMNPTIIPKLSVNYLGFWFNVKTNTWSKREFNTNNDPNAVNVLLNTPNLDFRVMTATTSQHLVFEKTVMDKLLKGKGGIGDYLINRWETYDRFWQATDKEKTKWTMWDVALLEALAYPELVEEKEVTTPHDNLDRKIKVYTKIEVPAMKANFAKAFTTFLKK
ncbi:MAG: nucleoside hydrolase [Bacteroidota bacterium]